MTDSTTLTPYSDDAALMAAWRTGNDDAEGYALGDASASPSEAARRSGATDIVKCCPEGSVACVIDGRVVVICDANGPWAVDVSQETEPLTREMIVALYGEAGNAGDTETVDACELALSGDTDARAEVARVINDARASGDVALRVVP